VALVDPTVPSVVAAGAGALDHVMSVSVQPPPV
jgi:hypothetical protein